MFKLVYDKAWQVQAFFREMLIFQFLVCTSIGGYQWASMVHVTKKGWRPWSDSVVVKRQSIYSHFLHSNNGITLHSSIQQICSTFFYDVHKVEKTTEVTISKKQYRIYARKHGRVLLENRQSLLHPVLSGSLPFPLMVISKTTRTLLLFNYHSRSSRYQ